MAIPFFVPAWIIPRRIGDVAADVTVSETGIDELYITQSPVEQGAAITDHAFKKPATVIIRAGFSNSSFAAAGDQNYTVYMYNRLLLLQNNRQPFDIVTGKRYYQSMLMQGLRQVTDETSEQALYVQAICQQVILVSTQTVSAPLLSAADQADPSKTAPIQNKGQQSLVPGAGINVTALPAGVPTS
jgi:hypothetical protein